MTTEAHEISSRQFNQDTSAAKRLATEGPVVITDRGRPAFVLMTFEEYQRDHAAGRNERLSDLLVCDADIELDIADRSTNERGTEPRV